MSSRLRIPVSATLAGSISGTVNVGPWKGKRVTLRLHEGYASKGYKSDFERIPHVWLEILIEGEKRQAYGCSGKNIQWARESFDKTKAQINPITS